MRIRTETGYVSNPHRPLDDDSACICIGCPGWWFVKILRANEMSHSLHVEGGANPLLVEAVGDYKQLEEDSLI